MTFQGQDINTIGYCQCKKRSSLTSVIEDTGYWLICCDCGKPIEDGFHYYNHFDGEDHEEWEEEDE